MSLHLFYMKDKASLKGLGFIPFLFLFLRWGSKGGGGQAKKERRNGGGKGLFCLSFHATKQCKEQKSSLKPSFVNIFFFFLWGGKKGLATVMSVYQQLQ